MVPFNDPEALEAALAHGDVACLLMEPALTNIGIVLAEEGFLDGVRELCTRHGTLLIVDETHTLSAGPGGCTAAWGLEPDAISLGKAIAGGVPIGAYGVSAELAERIAAEEDADYEDTGGVGGTLAGNALSLAATDRFRSRVESAIGRAGEHAGKVKPAITRTSHRLLINARARRAARPLPRTTGHTIN